MKRLFGVGVYWAEGIYTYSWEESGAGDIPITPDAGALTLTGATPTVIQAIQINPDAGSLALTGNTPLQALGVSPETGSLTLAGQIVGVEEQSNTDITPSAGSLLLAGGIPTLKYPTKIVLDIASGQLLYKVNDFIFIEI